MRHAGPPPPPSTLAATARLQPDERPPVPFHLPAPVTPTQSLTSWASFTTAKSNASETSAESCVDWSDADSAAGDATCGILCPANRAEGSCSETSEGESDEITSTSHESSTARHVAQRQEWWEEAVLTDAKSVAGLDFASQLLDARIVKHGQAPGAEAPWLPGKSFDLYEDMGAKNPKEAYLAVWLKINSASLVFLSVVEDPQRLLQCITSPDPLKQRMKFLLNPMNVPVPCKGARDADTITTFFGSDTQLCQARTDGPIVASLQIDLFAKWMLRVFLQKFGFRPGVTIEMIIIDWPGKAVLASMRLKVTTGFLQMAS